MTPKVVTLWYRAPELLFGEKLYTTAIDMWAVGCIFGEFIQCRPLLPGKNEQNQLELICRLLGTPNGKIWPEFESLPYARSVKLPTVKYDDVAAQFCTQKQSVRELLKSILTYHPAARYTVHKALQDQYFREAPAPCSPVLLPTGSGLRTEERDRKRAYEVRRNVPSKRVREEPPLELAVPAFKHFSRS